ncbi:HAMP domain-containing protein [Erysipelothrix sp. HDW6B]|uniref:sensor histidine kinase n=1 Tax=Erysipelothrix sp. HDW6B TaxID=2714929 RepID=UPI001408F474|nr:histidine kinase [Erysipelothrix sp. HDW6B]QIK86293.1 HAMP domain-containing protein [Erysipelothrix sp. HDW6B]
MKHSEFKTFEQKIEGTFIKYGRIPLLVTLLMAGLTFLGYYIYTNVFEVRNVQSYITQEVMHIESSIDEIFDFNAEGYDFSDMKENIEAYSNDIYQKYYAINSRLDGNVHMIMYDDANYPILITQPSLEGNDFLRYYHRLVLERLNSNDTIATVITNLGSDPSTKVVYGRNYTDMHQNRLKVLYFVDASVYSELLQYQRGNHLVLTDRFDNVIASTSRDFVTKSMKFPNVPNDTLSLEHTAYRVNSKMFGSENFIIRVLVKKDSLALTFMVVSVVVAVALYIVERINKLSARKIGREASRSIATLIEAVDRMKNGDLETHVSLTTHDEFEKLAHAFNDMGTQLSELISSNERLLELRKNAEIKQLEAQFNPHFLYNSLETIRYLIVDDPQLAEKLILNTTRLLRYSITPDANEVPFLEDIEYIKLYLEVNKLRLQERFVYTIDIGEDVLQEQLPKLLIQPLIENCLKHGYRYKDTLTVGVLGYSNETHIFLHVIDDGGGMNPAQLEALKSYDSKSHHVGYGIMSVLQRMELLYGDDGKVIIESDTMGTHISLIIPKGGNKDV